MKGPRFRRPELRSQAMTVEQVQQGYNWLIRNLYKYENYGARLVAGAKPFRPEYVRRGRGSKIDREILGILANTFRHYIFTTDHPRRRFFLKTLWQVMWPRPSFEKLDYAISYMISEKHFHDYVTNAHGDPEARWRAEPLPRAPGRAFLGRG